MELTFTSHNQSSGEVEPSSGSSRTHALLISVMLIIMVCIVLEYTMNPHTPEVASRAHRRFTANEQIASYTFPNFFDESDAKRTEELEGIVFALHHHDIYAEFVVSPRAPGAVAQYGRIEQGAELLQYLEGASLARDIFWILASPKPSSTQLTVTLYMDSISHDAE